MNDLREDIEAAMDAVPEPVEAAPEVVEAAPVVEAVEAAAPAAEPKPAAEGRDDKGRFAPKTDGAAPKPAIPAAGEQPKAPRAGAAAPVPPPGTAPAAAVVEALKAPQSWKPGAREEWAKIPPSAQQEIARREKEAAVAIQRGAEGSKIAEQLQQIVNPYLPMIQAEGSHPMQAIQRTMQAAAALRAPSPSHVAGTIASIVKEFGVGRFGPQFIDALAAAIDGGPAPQGQAPQQAQPPRDPRVDQLFARLEQAERSRSQTTQQKHAAEIESFASSHEFFDDVRAEVADLMEVAAKRGLDLSLQSAYDRAVSFHPEISSVLKQREAAENAKKAQASTTRARAAASSIRSTPAAAVGSAAQPDDVRGAIKAAMAANARR